MGVDLFHLAMTVFIVHCMRYYQITRKGRKEERKKERKKEGVNTVDMKFVENCQNSYIIPEYVTVDEK